MIFFIITKLLDFCIKFNLRNACRGKNHSHRSKLDMRNLEQLQEVLVTGASQAERH